MGFKKLAPALLAILALSAVVANSAMATAVETSSYWYVAGTKIPAETEHELICDLPPAPPGPIVFAEIGTTKLELAAKGLSCPKTTIYNESARAKTRGSLRFTGVSVVTPANCAIEGGVLETAELASRVYMEGTKALMRFAPASGTTFAKFSLTKGTGACAIAGTYSIGGSLFGEMVNATGVSATSQNLKFSGAINSAAGGALTLGPKPLVITAEFTSKLAPSGSELFKVSES